MLQLHQFLIFCFIFLSNWSMFHKYSNRLSSSTSIWIINLTLLTNKVNSFHLLKKEKEKKGYKVTMSWTKNSDHSVLEELKWVTNFFYKVGMESILDNAITNSPRNQKVIQTNHFYFLVNARLKKSPTHEQIFFPLCWLVLNIIYFGRYIYICISFHHPLYKYEYCNQWVYTFSSNHSDIKHDSEIIITCLIYELKIIIYNISFKCVLSRK